MWKSRGVTFSFLSFAGAETPDIFAGNFLRQDQLNQASWRNVNVNMAEAKKKLKKKTKIRESHRTFVRKIIYEAKNSLDGGESVDFKKLKSFKSTLEDKVLELKGMDQEVLEYLDDSKFDEDVSYSCDFASAIQACIWKQP